MGKCAIKIWVGIAPLGKNVEGSSDGGYCIDDDDGLIPNLINESAAMVTSGTRNDTVVISCGCGVYLLLTVQ